jgi:hypothetical protein
MQKIDDNPQAKRHIPYFRKGELVFQKSGHTLTHNKGYVCSKKQKGQCTLPEQRIKVENFERNFSHLAKSFEIPDEYKLSSVKKMIGDILHGQVDTLLESEDFEHDIFDNAVVLMNEDIEKNDPKQFKADFKDAVDAIEKESDRSTNFLVGILMSAVIAFGKKGISESDAGRFLAYLSEKVYLSDEGKIVKIKLTQCGDFVFQYMRASAPFYTEPFKWFVGERTFPSLDYKEVAKSISAGTFELSIPSMALGATFAKATNVIPNILKLDAKKAMQLVWFLNESPLGQTALQMQKFVKGRKRRKD